MRISAKIDYACRAILELSLHWPSSDPVTIQTISANQNIPEKFLTQILLFLKQHGYVRSTRGKSGGYTLLRKPQDIRLGQIFRDFEGPGNNGSSSAKGGSPFMASDCFQSIWSEAGEKFVSKLDEFTFEIIRQIYLKERQPIYYSI